MDFELIERHPWITGGTIVVGGLILFLIFRRRGASSDGTTAAAGVSYYPASSGTDPTAAALQAQQDQTAAALSATQIQASTQLGLATISADVAKLNISAGADVANQQTQAQTVLGVGTLNAQVALAQIQAQNELDVIRVIAAAYGGGGSSVGTGGLGSGITSSPTTTTQPVNQIAPPAPIYIPPVTAPSSPATPGGNTGNYPLPAAGGPVIAGGTPLEPKPNYIPV